MNTSVMAELYGDSSPETKWLHSSLLANPYCFILHFFFLQDELLSKKKKEKKKRMSNKGMEEVKNVAQEKNER